MTELSITYSEAKDTIEKMYSLIRRTIAGQREKLTLETAIYQDLGVIGLDWDSFIEEYEKEFNTTLEGLEYKIYFKERVSFRDILLIPLRIAYLPLLILPKNWTSPIRNILFKQEERKDKLTIGDLILSVIAKKFTKREETKIRIKYGS